MSGLCKVEMSGCRPCGTLRGSNFWPPGARLATTGDLLAMRATELDRLTVIERVRDRRLSQVDAAKQLGLTPRHISRLVDAFERDGPTALVSKRRGRRSNHAYADALKTRVLASCVRPSGFRPNAGCGDSR